jgi:CRISPR-associated endonuclease Csn1
VIELARDARQPAILRRKLLEANEKRRKEREQVIEEVLKPLDIPDSQWPKAIDRVLLARRQKWTCPYTGLGTGEGATITDQQAAAGTDVEIDHVIPESRSFDSSLNNKLVCRRAANRNKRDRTPREWLTDEQFAELETRLQHFKGDHPRAWANLHRDAPTLDEFVNSQLTDTGYISRQVLAYFRETLFPDAPHNVLCTKGVYTAILRRDWGLVDKEKKRSDHRHHALDAAVIACTDRSRLQTLARAAQAQERARAAGGDWPRREAIAPPWAGFRKQVAQAVENLVVAHRPERGLTGELHQARIYGKPVPGYQGVFTKRIPAADLTPPKLAEPRIVNTSDGGKTLRVGKGGVVRDPALRGHIRNCLEANGLDPDNFTKTEIKNLVKADHLRMPSGVPIRRVKLLFKIEGPIRVESDPRHPRYYIGGNNHHMEIAEDAGTGRWHGWSVRMFDAARWLHPSRREPRRPLIIGPHLDHLAAEGTLPQAAREF